MSVLLSPLKIDHDKFKPYVMMAFQEDTTKKYIAVAVSDDTYLAGIGATEQIIEDTATVMNRYLNFNDPDRAFSTAITDMTDRGAYAVSTGFYSTIETVLWKHYALSSIDKLFKETIGVDLK